MECKSLFEMLYLLSIFKNNDQYKYTLQCLKLCWTGAQHPVETWVVHRQSSVLLERLPCSRSTRNRIMHPILYLLSIQISVRLQHNHVEWSWRRLGVPNQEMLFLIKSCLLYRIVKCLGMKDFYSIFYNHPFSQESDLLRICHYRWFSKIF